MSTNVPSIDWTSTGLVIPSEAEILAGVQADFNAAFGGNMNVALNTPQGQWMTAIAAAIANAYQNIANLVNGVNPDLNSGFMQNAIARIYFINRMAGSPTNVSCTCLGLAGTVIPTGSPQQPQAEDSAGNLYYCVQGGTIPIGGSITLTFANVVNGPIACPMDSLTTIYQAVPGWDSINNPANGVPGTNIESSNAFEYRREQSVAANAHGSAAAIYGAVIDVEGVTDAYVIENFTGSTVDTGSTNFPVVAHSVYVGVIGGDPQDIANAIWTKKDLGCNMNGNTSETVYDTNYSPPQPSYSISFNNNTSATVAFNFTVDIKNSSLLPATIVADVTNAIATQFLGTNPNGNGQRVRIGSLLLCANFYGPVAACEGPQIPVQVLSILLGSAFSGQGTVTNMSDVLTITTASSGSLTPGTVVTDADNYIPANTQIVEQLTGSPPGGVGTYQMSAAATNTAGSPEAITGTATATSALIGIDQAPVLGTVTVNLI
jgi:uncharacterized phage protein gp47/JayE